MFDLKAPCNDCPFRVSQAPNYLLPRGRITEIVESTAFECHKTTGVMGKQKDPQQCAGVIAMLEDAQVYNAITRVAMMTGYREDFSYIDRSDTFDNIEKCIAAHTIDCTG